MSQHDMYDQVFRDRFGIRSWIPNWRPGADLRLGMAGRIAEREFIREYDLTDRGIALPDPAPPDEEPDEYQWSSEQGVEISVKATGETDQAFEAVAKAEVGFRLDFTKSDAMAMVYRDVIEQRLGDERALAEAMVESWNGGPWPKMQIGDMVITQVLTAGWGFAFGARSKGANVVMKADARVGPGGHSLADIKGKIAVASQQATSFAALSVKGGLVIGYRGLELKQEGLFLKRTVARPRYAALMTEEEDELILAREELPAAPT